MNTYIHVYSWEMTQNKSLAGGFRDVYLVPGQDPRPTTAPFVASKLECKYT
jgi:hypothetical protein